MSPDGGVFAFCDGEEAPAIAVTMRNVRSSMVNLEPDSGSSVGLVPINALPWIAAFVTPSRLPATYPQDAQLDLLPSAMKVQRISVGVAQPSGDCRKAGFAKSSPHIERSPHRCRK